MTLWFHSFRLYSDVGKSEYMIMDSGLTSIICYHCTHCAFPLLLLIELDKLEDNVFIINREQKNYAKNCFMYHVLMLQIHGFIVSFYVYRYIYMTLWFYSFRLYSDAGKTDN